MIAHARRTDPETSHAAAVSVGDLRWSQTCILQLLRTFGPMTDERLVDTYDTFWRQWEFPAQSAQSIRSRRAELVRLGLVEYSGEKGLMSTGRQARIWQSKI